MPRIARIASGGTVFHVLNRSVGRMPIFLTDKDYEAFERVIEETLDVVPMRICAYCVMPNHWHFVLWPENDEDLAKFMQLLTTTHTQRWKHHKNLVGSGPLYQGRYKSFPVMTDRYFYQVIRYVERNPLRANLVHRAEHWRWSSLARRSEEAVDQGGVVSNLPLELPSNWLQMVNEPQHELELEALRRCVRRNQPLGTDTWVKQISKQFEL